MPSLRQKVILNKVIDSRAAIKASKDVERVFVHYGHMTVAWTWCRANGQHYGPDFSLEVELVKVIDTVGSIVASKNVE